jgi:hypothetical protein
VPALACWRQPLRHMRGAAAPSQILGTQRHNWEAMMRRPSQRLSPHHTPRQKTQDDTASTSKPAHQHANSRQLKPVCTYLDNDGNLFNGAEGHKRASHDIADKAPVVLVLCHGTAMHTRTLLILRYASHA